VATTIRELAAWLDAAAPTALVLVGDRAETLAAGLAATLARVPIVHLHGGEETEGAVDNAFRHAQTKQSHLHLVSHAAHARRVEQMGEPRESIEVVGAPGLDNLLAATVPGRAELERSLGLALASPVILVTLHPTTLGVDPDDEACALTFAMDRVPATYVVTLPNNDRGADLIRSRLETFVAAKPRRVAVPALGPDRYAGMLRIADVVLGNSSSALIEAPLFGVPTVNVGDRQKGRLRGANVIDVEPEASAIELALHRALDPSFAAHARAAGSPYGDGHSGERIVAVLERWKPPNPPRKRFVDA
jgi:UDP-N-acetylglucosamine 2-epimerase (non-hydrolysing)/GDP/UDP-N,N'-diacetylbacillosamine 2-epimerase (hydrolysing)